MFAKVLKGEHPELEEVQKYNANGINQYTKGSGAGATPSDGSAGASDSTAQMKADSKKLEAKMKSLGMTKTTGGHSYHNGNMDMSATKRAQLINHLKKEKYQDLGGGKFQKGNHKVQVTANRRAKWENWYHFEVKDISMKQDTAALRLQQAI